MTGLRSTTAQTLSRLDGQGYPRPEDRPWVPGRVVTPYYFKTLDLSLLQGRGFDAEDRAASLPVAVVNATFATRFLPPGNPLGSRFRETTDGRWLTVVGCVPDALTYGTAGREAVYYMPLNQHPRREMRVLLRGSGKLETWMRPALAEIARLQPDLPFPSAETVQRELDGVDAGARGAGILLATCGAATLFLATLGIFGLISLSVNQRAREIGIRLSLGATRGGVMWNILKQALGQVGIGLAIGVLLGLALVRPVASLLPATATAPGVYVAVLTVLGAISTIAVWIPARRASKADPMVALRCE